MKEIRLESFLSDLLLIGIDSEVQSDGVWVEGKETQQSGIMRCGWDGDV